MANRDPENYRAWKRANYLKNREKEIERKKKYLMTERGRMLLNEYQRNLYYKNYEKSKARKQAFRAILDGRLVRKPCEVCGEIKVDAHHKDYTKPLEVTWLCRKHHGMVHRGPRVNGGSLYNW